MRSEADPIRVVLHIDDRVLAERLEALLANVRGLRLVGVNESADAALVPLRRRRLPLMAMFYLRPAKRRCWLFWPRDCQTKRLLAVLAFRSTQPSFTYVL